MNLIFILILILFFIFIMNYNKSYYIQKSDINGFGLFSNKDYKKNDVIIDDLFPYNSKRDVIKYLSKNDFDNYIINEGKYINHCSQNYNTDIITDDDIYFKLIAKKHIPKDKEIIANYDLIHRNFPFIAKSKEHYKKC